VKNEMTDQEATTLLAELEDFEKNNKDLADKTSDIEEWKAKVEEAEKVKEERDAMVLGADKKDRELAAILAQTPEAKVIAAKEIMMPNPRMADPESQALYAVCKFGKLYFIGDPYEHCLKVQQVIDQNFTDLAYTGKAIGSYTYAVKDTKKNENDYYLPVYEKLRLSRREKEALAAWDGLKLNMKNRVGEDIKETTVLKRIVGADDEAELAVHKFRFDLKKLRTISETENSDQKTLNTTSQKAREIEFAFPSNRVKKREDGLRNNFSLPTQNLSNYVNRPAQTDGP
jgi:hypothetical protein